MASNSGYWVLQECTTFSSQGNILQFLIKIGFTLANFFMWSCAIHSSAFIVFGVMMPYVACMRFFLNRYEGKYNRLRDQKTVMDRHAALKEIFLFAKVTQMYREIQIFSQAFNEVHQRFVLTASILCAIANQTILLYNLICTELSVGTILYLLLFLTLLVDLVVITLCMYGMMAELSRDSENKIDKLLLCRGKKINASSKATAWLKRFHRSCQPIKVQFGSGNWLEPLTPLNIEDFVISQTTNLLLLQ